MGVFLKRLSYLALLGFPLSVLAMRLDLLDFATIFQGLTITVVLAVVVFFIGMIVAFAQRKNNPSNSRAARIAAYLCLIPIIGIGSQVMTARSLPMIHNISTDVQDPPVFVKAAELRSATDNPLQYNSEELAGLQQAAYPQVKTRLVDMAKAEAIVRAAEVAESMGWEIINQDPEAGIVEATVTSFIWGFKDDVVIRIREQDDQSAIDLHSVSRIGKSDLGANAKRIKKFIAQF